MKTFLMSAVLKRTVIDDMTFSVRASSLDHAYDIARDFMSEYPDVKAFGKDVPFCAIENRQNVSTEILDISEDDEDA